MSRQPGIEARKKGSSMSYDIADVLYLIQSGKSEDYIYF